MNADAIARAICAAAKETGVDPIDLALGNDRSRGFPTEQGYRVSRARAYAGRALDRVFNHPVINVARPVIARLIGVNKPSYNAFFPSLDGRPTPWWDDKAYQRVVLAIEAGLVWAPLFRAPAGTPKPLAPKPVAGLAEDGGYRPPPDTIKKVLEDDARDKRFSERYVPVGPPIKKDDDFLRRAVENTVRMTPPPED